MPTKYRVRTGLFFRNKGKKDVASVPLRPPHAAARRLIAAIAIHNNLLLIKKHPLSPD